MKTGNDIAAKPCHPLYKRRSLWLRVQAIGIVASIVLLIDSELLLVGVPAARVITHLFNDSVAVSIVVWTVLVFFLLTMAFWLIPQIWKVECDLLDQHR